MEQPVSALLLEDVNDDFFLLNRIFKNHDFCKMIHAKNLREGKKLLEESSFDVLILDLNLPDSHGIETLHSVRDVAPDIPIVILTGQSYERTALNAIKSGAQDFIGKYELNFKTLQRTVSYAMERQKLLKEIKEKELKLRLLYEEVELKNKKLHELSIKDSLTGLYNRRFLSENLLVEFENCRRYGYPLFFMLIDLDGFKQINDQFGHLFGDKALKYVSDILSQSSRKSDVVGRFGGDEFCIFGHADSPEVANLVRRILNKLSCNSCDSITISLSMGIGILSEEMNTLDDLVRAADMALYRAKETGKSRGIIVQGESLEEVV